jgi:hypothetical protein
LRKQGLFFRLEESGWCNAYRCNAPRNPPSVQCLGCLHFERDQRAEVEKANI